MSLSSAQRKSPDIFRNGGRPSIRIVLGISVGWSFDTVMATYGGRWRLYRRLLHRYFRPEVNINYRPMQLRKSREPAGTTFLSEYVQINIYFIASLFNSHSASSALSAVYSYETALRDDPLVASIAMAIKLINSMGKDRVFVLSLFPLVISFDLLSRMSFINYFLISLTSHAFLRHYSSTSWQLFSSVAVTQWKHPSKFFALMVEGTQRFWSQSQVYGV